MAHTESLSQGAARRYLLASLAVQRRYRPLAPLSGLRPSRPAETREDGKPTAESSSPGRPIGSHRGQR